MFPLLAALSACQSDRFDPPRAQAGPYAPMAGYDSAGVPGRPLPVYPNASASAPTPQEAAPWPGSGNHDPLPGAYVTAQDKIALARETEPSSYKPSGMESLDSAQTKCGEMSRRAAARGTRALIIAFEGLGSFDPIGTRESYRYQLTRAAGSQTARPLFNPVPIIGGGYILHELLLPLVDRYGDAFEFLVYPHYEQGSDDSVPAVCARMWVSGAPGRRLIVIGHSAGGGAASRLVRSLQASRVWVDLVVTIDSVWTGGRTSNARRWENYHNAYPEVSGADVNLYIPTNHFSIPGSPQIYQSISRQLGAMIAVPTS